MIPCTPVAAYQLFEEIYCVLLRGIPYPKTLLSIKPYGITFRNTVRCATTDDAITNERYNKQFLSIKSGCYNEHKCYNERGGILSADVARACA